MFKIGSIIIKIQDDKRIFTFYSSWIPWASFLFRALKSVGMFQSKSFAPLLLHLKTNSQVTGSTTQKHFLIDSYSVICVVEDISISTLFQPIPSMKFSVSTLEMCQCSSTLISIQVLLYPLSFFLSCTNKMLLLFTQPPQNHTTQHTFQRKKLYTHFQFRTFSSLTDLCKGTF